MKDETREALSQVEVAARARAATLGLEVVEFVFHSRGKHSQLRIDIDRPGVPGAGLADCEALSRALDPELDQLEFFGDAYELQVSTPGLDRPIRTDDDLRRNTGRTVHVEFHDEAGRHRELVGVLAGAGPGGSVLIAEDGLETPIPRDRILLMKQDVGLARPRRKGRF